MAYTISTFTPSGTSDIARLWMPDGASAGPLLLYVHGVGGDQTEFGSSDYQGLRDRLLVRGWAILEVHAHGPQWGNEAGRDAWLAAYSDTLATWTPTDIVVFGRSMGGILGSWLHTYAPGIAAKSVGLILCSAVQDLMWAYDNGFSSSIMSAYGTASRAATVTAVAGRDPIAFIAADFTNSAILFQSGTEDTLVVPANNVQAQQARLASVLAVNESDYIAGDHYITRSRWQPHIEFLDLVAPVTPPVPKIARRSSRDSRSVFTNGQRFPVT